MDGDLPFERGSKRVLQRSGAEPGQAVVVRQELNARACSCEKLPELDSDTAAADDRDGRGNRLEVEDVVAHEGRAGGRDEPVDGGGAPATIRSR
jgi:hypothetical protein